MKFLVLSLYNAYLKFHYLLFMLLSALFCRQQSMKKTKKKRTFLISVLHMGYDSSIIKLYYGNL